MDRSSLAPGGEDEILVVDCVICMAAVDMAGRSTECMVRHPLCFVTQKALDLQMSDSSNASGKMDICR